MTKQLNEFDDDFRGWYENAKSENSIPYSKTIAIWAASWAFNRAKEIIKYDFGPHGDGCINSIEAEQKRLGL